MGHPKILLKCYKFGCFMDRRSGRLPECAGGSEDWSGRVHICSLL